MPNPEAQDEFDDFIEAITSAGPGSYLKRDESVSPGIVRSTLVAPTGVTDFLWHVDLERVNVLGLALVMGQVRVPYEIDSHVPEA